MKDIMRKLKRKLRHLIEGDQRKTVTNRQATVLANNIKNVQPKCEDSSKKDAEDIYNCRAETEHPEQYAAQTLSYGTFEDCPCASKCEDVAAQVRRKLQSVQNSKLHSELWVPKDLVRRLAHDVVTLSKTEPCGVRGCVLYLNLERKGCSTPLGNLAFEENSLGTFELYVTLVEEKARWSGFLHLLRTFFLPCSRPSFKTKIFVSPGYQVLKKKLYKVS